MDRALVSVATNMITFTKAQIASLLATGVDFGITFLLIRFAGAPIVAGGATGTICGGVTHFMISRNWVFSAREGKWAAQLNRYASSCLSDLLEYGPVYLSEEELERKVNEQLEYYYGFLAVSIIQFKGKEFWDYHRSRLKELGHPLRTSRLLMTGLRKTAREILNPEQAGRKLRKH